MSFAHTKAVWDARFSNSGLKLVALALADMANEAGECWPSVGYLAGRCEMSARMVNYHLRQLKSQGLVTTKSRYLNGQQRSNVFVFRDEIHFTPTLKPIAPTPCNALHPESSVESPIEPPLTKESKETSFGSQKDVVSFSATWKPDGRTKEQKLASIQPPDDYPSEREFEAFILENEYDNVINYRPNLYTDLCEHKWHQWREKLGKWVKVRDWHAYVKSLEETIARQLPS